MFRKLNLAIRIALLTIVVVSFLPISNVQAQTNSDQTRVPTRDKVIVGPDGKLYTINYFEYFGQKSTTSFALTASGCRTYTLGAQMLNILGNVIWKYTQSIDWCYNGTSITSKSRNDWANVYIFGWTYKGRQSLSESGGVGQSSYHSFAQGWFCMLDVGTCIWNFYPWVDQTVYGNGSYSGSADYQ